MAATKNRKSKALPVSAKSSSSSHAGPPPKLSSPAVAEVCPPVPKPKLPVPKPKLRAEKDLVEFRLGGKMVGLAKFFLAD